MSLTKQHALDITN